ncbi:hypothetical protein JW968_02650 [Candidatus Woesearchaeota archaeon]|nr:hypothetical protein [Candidatus Woesearchaeota archaeon]
MKPTLMELEADLDKIMGGKEPDGIPIGLGSCQGTLEMQLLIRPYLRLLKDEKGITIPEAITMALERYKGSLPLVDGIYFAWGTYRNPEEENQAMAGVESQILTTYKELGIEFNSIK